MGKLVWISDEMYSNLIAKQKEIKNKLGIKPSVIDVSKLMAKTTMPELIGFQAPRTRRKKWILEFDFKPKF